jgi:hypothetical protein
VKVPLRKAHPDHGNIGQACGDDEIRLSEAETIRHVEMMACIIEAAQVHQYHCQR